MPSITPKKIEPRAALNVTIPEVVAEELDLYCTYLLTEKRKVLAIIIDTFIRSDKKYQEWKTANSTGRKANGAAT